MGNNNNDLKKRLNQKITLSQGVEERVQAAYKIIEEKSMAESKPGKSKEKTRRISRWAAAAVTLVLMSTTAVAVLAATGFFSKNVVGEGNTVTYQFNLNYELVPGTFEVTPGYLPEGFVEQEEGKYCPEDNWGHGISILPIMNTVELEKQGNQLTMEGIEQVEETTLSGMEAHVITMQEEDKYRCPKYIYLFNQEEGFVLEIYGDYIVPLEELKQFANHLTVTRTGDAKYESEQEKAERQSEMEAEEESMRRWDELVQERRRIGIQESEFISLGEEARSEGVAEGERLYEDTGYTVKSAELIDSISGYDQNGFFDYAEVEPWMNADGSLKPYIRQHFDAEGNVTAEEEVKQQFLAVRISAKKYNVDDENANSKVTPLDAVLKRLVKREDGSYTWPEDSYEAVPNQEYYLQTDSRCIYFDQPEFIEGDDRDHQFFWRTMEAGEELEYTLIFVVDEDMTDSVFLDFNGFALSETDEPVYYSIR